MQAQPRCNQIDIPDRLKAGIESLSGIDMSDVRVHANPDLLARLDAMAYTQGKQIYLGPGQERHMPHEARHVVQQKQGRVKPTRQLKRLGINNQASLEGEADHDDRVMTRPWNTPPEWPLPERRCRYDS